VLESSPTAKRAAPAARRLSFSQSTSTARLIRGVS
jgi:hypothetical protein